MLQNRRHSFRVGFIHLTTKSNYVVFVILCRHIDLYYTNFPQFFNLGNYAKVW
jgi:hypothetical protein